MRVVFTARADGSIEKADAWWREHREKNPELFTEELIAATWMLRHAPHIGKRALDVELQGVRFVILQKTEKLLYYRVLEEEDVVELLLVWGARKEHPPKLKKPGPRRRR